MKLLHRKMSDDIFQQLELSIVFPDLTAGSSAVPARDVCEPSWLPSELPEGQCDSLLFCWRLEAMGQSDTTMALLLFKDACPLPLCKSSHDSRTFWKMTNRPEP